MTIERSEDVTIESLRAKMEAAYGLAQARTARRLLLRDRPAPLGPTSRVNQLLEESRKRIDKLIGVPDVDAGRKSDREVLLPRDLHLLEKLDSHIRHSIVRVCFYNLKLLCPSLIDEYSEEIDAQIVTQIDQLPVVRAELNSFFSQKLSSGNSVGDTLYDVKRDVLDRLDVLIRMASSARQTMDLLPTRTAFGEKAPAAIDSVMNALERVQAILNENKQCVWGIVKEAVEISRPFLAEQGITIELQGDARPRIFLIEAQLLNAVTEIIVNAGKYSSASHVIVNLDDSKLDDRFARITVEDNGNGMSEKELEHCVEQGVSTSGTGDGLPMVIQIVEVFHLGEFRIESSAGQGCKCEIKLPLRFRMGSKEEIHSAYPPEKRPQTGL